MDIPFPNSVYHSNKLQSGRLFSQVLCRIQQMNGVRRPRAQRGSLLVFLRRFTVPYFALLGSHTKFNRQAKITQQLKSEIKRNLVLVLFENKKQIIDAQFQIERGPKVEFSFHATITQLGHDHLECVSVSVVSRNRTRAARIMGEVFPDPISHRVIQYLIIS